MPLCVNEGLYLVMYGQACPCMVMCSHCIVMYGHVWPWVVIYSHVCLIRVMYGHVWSWSFVVMYVQVY